MSTNRSLLALIILVVLAVVGVTVALRTEPGSIDRGDAPAQASAGDAAAIDPDDLPILADRAPAVDADGWLNADPLEAGDLAGKVVLYEFWTFGCSNCRAVLPYVEAWHERYADDGLVVLSIHTPEFDYEADPEAVAGFVDEQDVRFPVALDPDRRTWEAFDNHYWPAMYLHDHEGRRRYVHIGEGEYDRTEDAIRALLGVDADAPRAEVRG